MHRTPPPFPTLSGDQGGLQIIVGTADLEFVQVQVLAGAEKILVLKVIKFLVAGWVRGCI